MRKQRIKYVLKKESLKNVTSNRTVKTYKRGLDKFIDWLEEKDIKYVEDIKDRRELIQEYQDALIQECYSPSTIHTYLAPICKGFNVSMKLINKPKRTAGHLNRSRNRYANQQGKKETEKEEFIRLVNTQKALGIRRSELAKLTGSDLVKTTKNGLYVRVTRGKGGKTQLQKILPQHEKQILDVFKDVGKNEKVFSCREMSNKIDLHGMRAELAKEAYDYYAERLKDPIYEADLKELLCDRYLDYCKHCQDFEDMEEWRKQNIDNQKPYILRGENRENALMHNRPIEYDRLAMMAVSVLHLSHWRLDVTSVNYLA